jgi:hypothetical protein
MAKYLLLYHGGGMPETEEETAKVMAAWEAWYGQLGAAVADPGNPFTPAAKGVAPDGSVSDGPVGTMASGYTVLEADSLDAATEMAKGCPVLAGGASISIFETFEVM